MTENEAIKEIMGWTCALLRMGRECTFETSGAQEMAIKALEEIQQYRKIGTVEECREAVENQKPKKPILKNGESGMFVDYADGHGEYKVTKWQDWVCPVCGWFVGQRYNAIRNRSKPHPHDQRKCEYCNCCGAKIDWSDNG